MPQSYRLLSPEQKPLVEELLARFSAAELLELARALPIDARAAHAIWPQSVVGHLDSLLNAAAEVRGRPGNLAVYVACAAHHAASKILGEILRRRQQDKHTLEELTNLLARVDTRGARLLSCAIRGKTDPAALAPGPADLKG